MSSDNSIFCEQKTCIRSCHCTLDNRSALAIAAGVTMGPDALLPATFSTLPVLVVWATQAASVMRMWMSVLFPHHVVMVPHVATQMAHTTVSVRRATRDGTVSSTQMTVPLVSTGPCAEATVEMFYYGL